MTGTVTGMDVGVAVSPDRISLGVLVAAEPRNAVGDAIAVCGVGAKRSDRKLPPHVVAYLTMVLCLFTEDDYTEVTGWLDRWGCWDAAWSVPTTSAITGLAAGQDDRGNLVLNHQHAPRPGDGRATFYVHFDSKSDIVAEFFRAQPFHGPSCL